MKDSIVYQMRLKKLKGVKCSVGTQTLTTTELLVQSKRRAADFKVNGK
jgi:hypothetical protein